jgi:ABC-type Fe3+-citrate transport system substrate-binding protein
MTEEQDKALQELSDISQEFEKAYKQHDVEMDDWWNQLTQNEREAAFYSVCKRIHKGDLQDNGSYRYVLYDTFGFDPGMYVNGMNCGYMAIHNAIFDGEELQRMKSVNRFEVIDDTGRAYVKYLDKDERIKYTLQDDDKTLKVFIDKTTWKEDL